MFWNSWLLLWGTPTHNQCTAGIFISVQSPSQWSRCKGMAHWLLYHKNARGRSAMHWNHHSALMLCPDACKSQPCHVLTLPAGQVKRYRSKLTHIACKYLEKGWPVTTICLCVCVGGGRWVGKSPDSESWVILKPSRKEWNKYGNVVLLKCAAVRPPACQCQCLAMDDICAVQPLPQASLDSDRDVCPHVVCIVGTYCHSSGLCTAFSILFSQSPLCLHQALTPTTRMLLNLSHYSR